MGENMNTTEQTTQAENMGTEGQGAAQGNNDVKMFTQEEVNGFVQNRISRMRGQIEKEIKTTYDQKMADLNAREMRLLVKEKLSDRGMPKELADIITCSDEEDLNKKLDALDKIYGGKAVEQNNSDPKGFVLGAGNNGTAPQRHDAIAEAMGLKR